MAKVRLSPRQLMERAIAVMHASIEEPRKDDKACPKVGAVLVKANGTLETACRGELRYGDHAEFTLLERKNRDKKLDGAILFTTLEPCAPGSRSHRKMSCAERIESARIKEVWIGVEDPDPLVDRKGIKYLQDQGIPVRMFDRDLQDEIKAANKEFFRQALERAAAADKSRKTVILSSLEEPFVATTWDEFSIEALDKYRSTGRIEDSIESPTFRQRLVQQGLLKEDHGKLVPTGFGLLLFGKEPRTSLPQAGLLGTINYGDEKAETRDFDGPLVLIPSLVEKWLNDKLPAVLDRSRMQRRVTSQVPFEMLREAIVNALIHRDYDIREAKCQLVITPDSITVKSPGGPVPPIQLEQLQSFDAPMLSRNPELHYVFAKMEIAEERGLGLKSLKHQAQILGLPLPKYEMAVPYLVLTIFLNQAAVAKSLAPDVLKSLSESELRGLEWLRKEGRARSQQYAQALGVEVRTARRHLTRFLQLGLVKKTGVGPGTEYLVV